MNSLFKPEFGIDTKIIEHDPPTRDPTLYDQESDDKEFVAGSQQRSPKRQSQSSSTLGSATHRLKSWWNSLSASSSSVKTENTREVDPRDDPRHYLESNEYDFRAHHKNILIHISRNDFKHTDTLLMNTWDSLSKRRIIKYGQKESLILERNCMFVVSRDSMRFR